MRSHYMLMSSSESTVSYNRNEREKASISPPYKRHQPWSPSSREELWLGAWVSTSSEKCFQQPSLLSELEPKWSLAKWILTERWAPNELSAISRIPVCCFSPDLSFVCASWVDVTAHWHFYLEAERPGVSLGKLCSPFQLCILGGVAQYLCLWKSTHQLHNSQDLVHYWVPLTDTLFI